MPNWSFENGHCPTQLRVLICMQALRTHSRCHQSDRFNLSLKMKLENYSKALIPTTQQLFIVSKMALKSGRAYDLLAGMFYVKLSQSVKIPSYRPEGRTPQF